MPIWLSEYHTTFDGRVWADLDQDDDLDQAVLAGLRTFYSQCRSEAGDPLEARDVELQIGHLELRIAERWYRLYALRVLHVAFQAQIPRQPYDVDLKLWALFDYPFNEKKRGSPVRLTPANVSSFTLVDVSFDGAATTYLETFGISFDPVSPYPPSLLSDASSATELTSSIKPPSSTTASASAEASGSTSRLAFGFRRRQVQSHPTTALRASWPEEGKNGYVRLNEGGGT
ncbi:hypothetical protein JCM11251_000820 [Rhodosporidiobolus azoricus]